MKKILSIALLATCAAASTHAADLTGVSSAVFTNPTPLNTTYSGLDTSSFTWGDPGRSPVGANNFTFTGTSFSAPVHTVFKIGTLSYFNGTTQSGTSAATLDLKTGLNFGQSTSDTVFSSFALGLTRTVNTSDPLASADSVSLKQLISPTRFEINGVNYALVIEGFRNLIGDGFLRGNGKQLNVLEGKRATVDLYGEVTPVPEPETYALMLVGLGALAAVSRRKKASMVISASEVS